MNVAGSVEGVAEFDNFPSFLNQLPLKVYLIHLMKCLSLLFQLGAYFTNQIKIVPYDIPRRAVLMNDNLRPIRFTQAETCR